MGLFAVRGQLVAWAIALVAAAGLAPAALAQNTDRNVALRADDAFGKSIRRETIGIYDADNVRGFSPAEAGNVRIEGLFFDEQGALADQVVDEETIRVGISAQSYPFPAPTGIVDYSLRKAGEKLLLATAVDIDSWGGKRVDADLQVPRLVPKTSLAAGLSFSRERTSFGGTPNVLSMGGVGRWQLTDRIEVLPFASMTAIRGEEVQPLIFTAGDFLPPQIRRNRFTGQRWAVFDGNLVNAGVSAKGDVGGLSFAFGLFHSVDDEHRDHSDLLYGADETGAVANRVVVTTTGDVYASTSGEARLSHVIKAGRNTHTIIVNARWRSQRRRYGGAEEVSLGPFRIGVVDDRPEPATVQGAKTHDTVRQASFGISYESIWDEAVEFGAGIQAVRYWKKRRRASARAARANLSIHPLIWNTTVAVHLSEAMALYAGTTTGLEDSPVAPSNAANRREAPPAIRTHQIEAGLRWMVSPELKLIVGGFAIAKPYFSLDDANVFRQLGQLRNRGMELSLTGTLAPGVNILAGGLLVDPTVTGVEVDSGKIGRRPIGAAATRLIFNLTVQVPQVEGLSVQVGGDAVSSRVANQLGTFRIPATASLSLSGRYKFNIGPTPVLARLEVHNALNGFSWNVDGGGAFTPNAPRRVELNVSADF